MIVLEMKCPQLSKPEATAARNENSIGDRMQKKTLGETRLSRGASSPLKVYNFWWLCEYTYILIAYSIFM